MPYPLDRDPGQLPRRRAGALRSDHTTQSKPPQAVEDFEVDDLWRGSDVVGKPPARDGPAASGVCKGSDEDAGIDDLHQCSSRPASMVARICA